LIHDYVNKDNQMPLYTPCDTQLHPIISPMARGDNMELTLAKGDINVILDDDNHINQDCQSPLVTHSDTSLVPGAWNDNLYQTSLSNCVSQGVYNGI
jgi:hypothetical protein